MSFVYPIVMIRQHEHNMQAVTQPNTTTSLPGDDDITSSLSSPGGDLTSASSSPGDSMSQTLAVNASCSSSEPDFHCLQFKLYADFFLCMAICALMTFLQISYIIKTCVMLVMTSVYLAHAWSVVSLISTCLFMVVAMFVFHQVFAVCFRLFFTPNWRFSYTMWHFIKLST